MSYQDNLSDEFFDFLRTKLKPTEEVKPAVKPKRKIDYDKV